MDIDLFTTLAGVLLGGGILAFIQFLITRHDSKHDRFKSITDAIKALSDKVDTISAKSDERFIITTRVRILRFEDEMQRDMKHSKDAWSQCLEDCKEYEQYTTAHTEFANNITEATIQHIKKEYAERLEKHDFL